MFELVPRCRFPALGILSLSLKKKREKLRALQGVSVVCGKLQTMTDATELISKKKTGGV